VALEVAGSLEDVVSRFAEVSVKRDFLAQILLELLAASSRSGQPASKVLKKGLSLRARVAGGRREVLAFRDPGGASQLEADVVRRALGFPCHAPVPFSARGGAVNGWQIAEMLEEEVEASREAIRVQNEASHRSSRVDHALKLMLELFPQHLDTVDGYVELWRDGLEQFPELLEGKIAGFEAALAARRAAPVVVPDAGQSEAML
jgi:hypothetical protein